LTLALLAALRAGHAARALEQPERPYELSLAQLTLPSAAGGGVTVKRCDACAYSTHMLTAATQFFVNGQSLSFEEFSSIAEQVRGHRRAYETAFVGLFVDVETGRVNRVTLLHKGL
jgi:hypothetical protein